tara:strand:+ start:90 stop:569 length:480 start_codon:yes stop_codon:yes gene_type:complete
MGTFNVTGAGGTTGHPSNGRTPYLVENTIDISQVDGDAGAAQNDVLQVLDLPAETLVMFAGIEVLVACSSSVVLDLGITGSTAGFSDPDAYVDGYDATGASYAPILSVLKLQTKVAETLDVLVAGAASSAGKIRVWAILCDISGVSETDTNTAAQHDTE